MKTLLLFLVLSAVTLPLSAQSAVRGVGGGYEAVEYIRYTFHLSEEGEITGLSAETKQGSDGFNIMGLAVLKEEKSLLKFLKHFKPDRAVRISAHPDAPLERILKLTEHLLKAGLTDVSVTRIRPEK